MADVDDFGLRPYQVHAVERLREGIRAGVRRQVLQVATGGGKTKIAAAMTVLLFSIAGIPPVAGFWGKWFAFSAAWNAGLVWLVALAAIATVIAAAYYLNIIRVMWMAPPKAVYQTAGPAVIITAGIGALLCFPVLWVAIGWVEYWATLAARQSF